MITHLAITKYNARAPIPKGLGEWFFALFLFAGYYKADPRFAFIQTYIDLTLLFLFLSFLVFLRRLLKEPFVQKMPAGFVKVATFFLLLAACLLGGLFITQSEGYGFDKTVRFIVLTGWAFFGTAFLITDYLSLRSFSWAVVTISTMMAIDALLNYPGVGKIGFVTALGSNYIALARAGGLGLLATLVFLLPTERKPLAKCCLWGIAVLQTWATLSAGARGPVLALVISLLVFFALSVWGFPHLKVERFSLKLSMVLLIAVVLVTTVAQELFSTFLFRMQVLTTYLGESAAMRLDLYQEALRLWVGSPIWGVGTGGFAVAVTGSEFIREYPHNIVLELAAETGLLGVLVLGMMIFMAFSIGLASIKNSSGLARITARYLLVSACFALLNAMVSGDINDNRMLFTYLGLIAITTRFEYGGEKLHR